MRGHQKNNQSEIDLTDPMDLTDLKNLMVIKSWVTCCAKRGASDLLNEPFEGSLSRGDGVPFV